ncbi:MAG: phosphatidate cytidylyltransferase [Ilumatobacteraceae bacterium]
MSDDAWRRKRREEGEDFGPPLFDDEPTTEVRPGDLSFGDSDTGSLPHWTEPPTGEIPRVLSAQPSQDPTDDLDVWSTFSSQAPVWRDDPDHVDVPTVAPAAALDQTGGESYDPASYGSEDTGRDLSAPVRREPGRITIGTDPSDAGGRPMPRRGRQETPARNPRNPRSGRPAQARPGAKPPTAAGRDMPTAVAVGIALAAVFIAAILWRPAAVLAIVVVVLGLAAIEFFDKVSEKNYRPASVVGIVACITAPLAAYWVGETALPLVLTLALAASAVTFICATNIESAPMPNMAITALGVTWIALLGSYAGLILRFPSFGATASIGTDTLCLLAIGVVANDIGALFVGSAGGRHPLRSWISPNKTIEGLVGGTVATLVVLAAIGASGKSHTWNSLGDGLLLGVIICVLAPLGDLTESMFKRNLEVKDFGTLVKGHGGVLDRFDGFLFTLPGAYYLLEVLKPWVTK